MASAFLKLREERGWTQAQAARVFRVSVSCWHRWETGRRNPSGPALALIDALAEIDTGRRALARRSLKEEHGCTGFPCVDCDTKSPPV